MIKILFICHGNICRSVMAQFVFQHLANEQGNHHFIVDSAATSREEIGNTMYEGTRNILEKYHIPYTSHYAQQITKKQFEEYDYIVAMDDYNIRNLEKMFPHKKKAFRLLDVTNEPRNIRDPWYTGNFEETYEDVKKGCEALLTHILSHQ